MYDHRFLKSTGGSVSPPEELSLHRGWHFSRHLPTKACIIDRANKKNSAEFENMVPAFPKGDSYCWQRPPFELPSSPCHKICRQRSSSWKLQKGKERCRATEWRLPMPFDCLILQSWSLPPFESPPLNSSMLTSAVLVFVFLSSSQNLHVFISLPHKPTQVRTTRTSLADASGNPGSFHLAS